MNELLNKKILLVALKGYSNGIKNKMEELGAQVDYINDKPNDGFICKTCGRYKFKPYMHIIDNYYVDKINSLKDRDYDYILVIRGEYTTQKALKTMKEAFPKSKLILYMWDSVRNNRGIEKLWSYYDKVFTFDRIDYLANKDKIDFLPLYYYEDMLPTQKIESFTYDMAFIGTGHGDRVKIVNGVTKQCQQENLNIFTYIFLPHKFVFLYNKLLNYKNYKGIKSKQINYKMMPFKEAYQIYANSKCIMDVESSTQCGLTMRTIEMIGLKKKLITTNRDIVNYDFYHPNNVMVVDRNDFKIDREFFDKPYVELDEDIYTKYALASWILNVLE